jgi:hypothetical protein
MVGHIYFIDLRNKLERYLSFDVSFILLKELILLKPFGDEGHGY